MKKIVFYLFLFPLLSVAQDDKSPENIVESRDNHTYELEIKHKNGVTDTINSIFYENLNNNSMLLYDAEADKEIYPEETEYIQLVSSPDLKGVSKDNSWLFASHKGEITIYSIFPETKLKYADFIEKNNKMIPFEKETLFEMLQANPTGADEVAIIKARNKWSKILGFSGLTSIIGGIVVSNFNSKISDSKYVFWGAGLGLFAISLPLEIFTRKREDRAVDVYNSHK